MKRLWAPWRSKFIYLKKTPKCIFCGNRKMAKDTPYRHIIDRSKYSFSILNIYPYNNGHVLIAPYRHVASLENLTSAEITDMMKLVNKTLKLLRRKLKPHGFNVGLNIGKVAGAGFAGHIHIHIVPRWHGDTNFMPVVCDEKVMPESLSSMLDILRSE